MTAPEKQPISWTDIETGSLRLAKMIQDHCRTTGESFDKMLVIPRGGYYPASIIARVLGFEASDLLHACITSYAAGQTERGKTFSYGQMPKKADIAGRHLLVIEEMCDTGHTLAELMRWLKKAGAKQVRTGVLHYKPNRSQTDFRPDWWAEETDKWVVYPGEQYEINSADSSVRRQLSDAAAA